MNDDYPDLNEEIPVEFCRELIDAGMIEEYPPGSHEWRLTTKGLASGEDRGVS